MYRDPAEVELRRQKRERQILKAQEAKDNITKEKRQKEEREKKMKELEATFEAMKNLNANNADLSDSKIKQLEKDKRRREKMARRYDEQS